MKIIEDSSNRSFKDMEDIEEVPKRVNKKMMNENGTKANKIMDCPLRTLATC